MKRVPPPSAVPKARRLRRDTTDAEQKLWRLLREAFPDQRFRRQVPIRHFIVDFASHRCKLVIEAGGGQHEAAIDLPRTTLIEGEGYRVLRFWNDEILGNSDGVLQVIANAIADASPSSNFA